MSFSSAYDVVQKVIHDGNRLAAVRATGLLDTEVEEAFDRLTRLAVRLVKIPAAFVSLVDENRDFYKSACGFGESLTTARQLEGPTFCHFTVQAAEPLIIPDTRADPVYRDVPTVQSLGVAAYVGIPIVVNGHVIGAFCAIDFVPHAWTDDEVASLKELAEVAVSEISLRASRAEAERFREEAEQLADASLASQHELQDQAKVLTRQAEELELARAEADRANRAKSDFLAAMSHDLRTPLTAIGGYAQLIELGVHGPVTDGQRDAAARIHRAQRHLHTIIGDILQFAKLEGGDIVIEPRAVSLSELGDALDSLVRQQAAEKGIAFECDLGGGNGDGNDAMAVLADHERALQILVNLTTNAIKFTDTGGRVSLTARRAGEWAAIAVSDSGKGITKEQMGRIFEPFVQLGSAAGNRAGVGLGLATSRTLARRMGGEIDVESEEGVGSTFTLRLPSALSSRDVQSS
ncbi:MAG: GAF domain-containing sensor histidine kinase [bacterium]